MSITSLHPLLLHHGYTTQPKLSVSTGARIIEVITLSELPFEANVVLKKVWNKNEFHISKRSLHIIDIGVMNKSLQNISLPVIFSNLGIFIYFLGIFP